MLRLALLLLFALLIETISRTVADDDALKRKQLRKTQVLIVGGGYAGIAAYNKLRSKGMEDVIVAEASNDIGGRTKVDTTFTNEIFPIDLGASFVTSTFKRELESKTENDDLPLKRIPNSFGFVWENYSYYNLLIDYFRPPEKAIETMCIVYSIDYGSDNSDDESSIEAHCLDGRSFLAKRVIVAVPLSVLKDDDINFSPELPIHISRLVSDRPWWAGFKVFIEFDTNDFYDHTDWFCPVDGDCSTRHGESLFWDFTKFTSPSDQPYIMGGYFVGSYVEKEFNGSTSESEIIDRVLELIGDYFKDRRKVFNSYKRHLFYDWSSEPYIRGCYSGYLDSISFDDDDYNVNKRLFFAGEAFPVDGQQQAWVSTAWFSGNKAADKILDLSILTDSPTTVIPTSQPTKSSQPSVSSSPTSFEIAILNKPGSYIGDEKSDSEFNFKADAFETNNPSYSKGTTSDDETLTLQVQLGGTDSSVIDDGMSGGWQFSFTLNTEAKDACCDIEVEFDYRISFSSSYDDDEYSEVRVGLDDTKVIVVERIGSNSSFVGADFQKEDSFVLTGTSHISTFRNVPGGRHYITFGGYNNKKSHRDEYTLIQFKNISIIGKKGQAENDNSQLPSVSAPSAFMSVSRISLPSGKQRPTSQQNNIVPFANLLEYRQNSVWSLSERRPEHHNP